MAIDFKAKRHVEEKLMEAGVDIQSKYRALFFYNDDGTKIDFRDFCEHLIETFPEYKDKDSVEIKPIWISIVSVLVLMFFISLTINIVLLK